MPEQGFDAPGLQTGHQNSAAEIRSNERVILRFPRVNRTIWFRLASLAHHRGEHPATLQAFLKHATYEAGAYGRLRDVPRLIETYAAAEGITQRSAWRALKAACQRGWIRKTQGAAPGVRARYELQVPVDLVVGDLPEDLEQLLRLWDVDTYPEHDHADALHGHLTDAPIVPVCLIPPHEHEGAQAPAEAPETAPEDPANHTGLTECQTSPSYAKAQFLLWLGTSTTPGEISEPVRARADRPPTPAEAQAARNVLVRCVPWWTQQRGPGAGSLSAAQVAELVEPVAYALRRSTPTELVEVLTVQTRSAESLAHVVGHRLWKLIKTRAEWRRFDRTDDRTDEEGRRYAALLERRREQHEANRVRAAEVGLSPASPTRARGVDRITELAARFRVSGRARTGADPTPTTDRASVSADSVISRWSEPEDQFRAEMVERFGDPLDAYAGRTTAAWRGRYRRDR